MNKIELDGFFEKIAGFRPEYIEKAIDNRVNLVTAMNSMASMPNGEKILKKAPELINERTNKQLRNIKQLALERIDRGFHEKIYRPEHWDINKSIVRREKAKDQYTAELATYADSKLIEKNPAYESWRKNRDPIPKWWADAIMNESRANIKKHTDNVENYFNYPSKYEKGLK